MFCKDEEHVAWPPMGPPSAVRCTTRHPDVPKCKTQDAVKWGQAWGTGWAGGACVCEGGEGLPPVSLSPVRSLAGAA